MQANFEQLGVTFQYPDGWTLDSQAILAGGRELTVYSPGGAFWSLAIHDRQTDPRALVDEFVNTMRAEYQNVDHELLDENAPAPEALACEVNFYCLDLTITAIARVFCGAWANYLVLYQAEDREFAQLADVFDAMTHSFVRESLIGDPRQSQPPDHLADALEE
ncbi:MAG: hypothetical protein SFX18_02365 [Pirellulales bacterium]|nr:hypothetical protein [Pirellulales bacterium]